MAYLLGRSSFIFLVVVLSTAEPVFAQDAGRRGFIGLGIGPSAPFGSFADTSPANERAGRAVPGYTDTFLNIAYRFGERVGVAGAFTYSEYDMEDVEDDDWWQVASITAGPMYSYPINARAALDLKAMLGVMVMTPIIDSYTTGDQTGIGIGIDMRANVRYDVFRRWAVFADGGLQLANVSFPSGVRKDYRALISGFGIAFRPAW